MNSVLGGRQQYRLLRLEGSFASPLPRVVVYIVSLVVSLADLCMALSAKTLDVLPTASTACFFLSYPPSVDFQAFRRLLSCSLTHG
jgi:hypothetical protein